MLWALARQQHYNALNSNYSQNKQKQKTVLFFIRTNSWRCSDMLLSEFFCFFILMSNIPPGLIYSVMWNNKFIHHSCPLSTNVWEVNYQHLSFKHFLEGFTQNMNETWLCNGCCRPEHSVRLCTLGRIVTAGPQRDTIVTLVRGPLVLSETPRQNRSTAKEGRGAERTYLGQHHTLFPLLLSGLTRILL